MTQAKVLVYARPDNSLASPWMKDLMEVLEGRFATALFDHQRPVQPQFEGYQAVIELGLSMPPEILDAAAAAGVRYVQTQSNGIDHIDVNRFKAHGIALSNCPSEINKFALSQSAMMFILMLAGRYRQSARNFTDGVYYRPSPYELGGRTLGIVGLGASGQELAKRAKAFGMRIMGIDVIDIDAAVLDEIKPEFMGKPEDLDRVVTESDFLSVHLHLNQQTHHIIDARRIAMLKPTACVINVCRGALIDEEALYTALVEGRIGGAGLDVFAAEPPDPALPVYQLPTVVTTPHNGGGSEEVSRGRAEFAADNVDRFLSGQQPNSLL
jgi:phosphoglycerate dehydrogenase-like enzyme